MKLNSFKALLAVTVLAGLQAPVLAQSHLVNIGADGSGNFYFVDARTFALSRGSKFASCKIEQ
ncbi:MAG: hypothetical protein KME29_31695 [Calothrix sp. FI2-JRJ7]|jgi:hypothetical protein|nr:hypothetical protein [Calothrix sp. FI2-JRJ7]